MRQASSASVSPQRRSQLRYSDRDLARRLALRGLAAGKITKTPCEVCGATEVEMHHEDYRAPLEVNMLCKKHHVEADQRKRDEGKLDKGATPAIRTSIKLPSSLHERACLIASRRRGEPTLNAVFVEALEVYFDVLDEAVAKGRKTRHEVGLMEGRCSE